MNNFPLTILKLGWVAFHSVTFQLRSFNSPLWKRVIAWERSRAASGYGIIWGTQIETNKRNLIVRNVIAWIGFNRTTDSNKIEVIVLDDQK